MLRIETAGKNIEINRKLAYVQKQRKDQSNAKDTHDEMLKIGNALFLQSNKPNLNYKTNFNVFNRSMMNNTLNYQLKLRIENIGKINESMAEKKIVFEELKKEEKRMNQQENRAEAESNQLQSLIQNNIKDTESQVKNI